MMDWLGKMLDLPQEFLACSGGKGGGVIQGTASEATLVALLGAKAKKVQEIKAQHPDWEESFIISKLVAYCSAQSHSSVERAGLLGGVRIKMLPADERNSLRGAVLEEYIKKDLEEGLIPFYVIIILYIFWLLLKSFQYKLIFCYIFIRLWLPWAPLIPVLSITWKSVHRFAIVIKSGLMLMPLMLARLLFVQNIVI